MFRKMGWWALIGLTGTVTTPAQAAFESKPFSAQAASMGEAMVAAPGDTYSLYYNPAALRFVNQKSLTLGHAQLLGDADLPHNVLGVALPTRRFGAWGLQASQFGNSLYQETEAGLGFGSWIGEHFSGGVGIKHQQLKIEHYGSANGLNLDAGLMVQPWDNIWAGASLRNVAVKKIGGVEAPTQEIQAGVSARYLGRALTAVAARHSANQDLTFRIGQEFWIHSLLALRAGYETGINRLSFGLGLKQDRFGLDYAFLTQSEFSDQHQMNVTFRWGGVVSGPTTPPPAPLRKNIRPAPKARPTPKPAAAPTPKKETPPAVENITPAAPDPEPILEEKPSPRRRFQLK